MNTFFPGAMLLLNLKLCFVAGGVCKNAIITWGVPGIPKTKNLSNVEISLLTWVNFPRVDWNVWYFYCDLLT